MRRWRSACASAGINGLTDALREAEARALRSGKAEEAAVGDGCAIAHPLSGSDTREGVVGLVSVGRSGRAFTAGERDLFHYLATQAGVSMENVGLHETVARESVTDELTGLFNRRRFDEVLDTEVERAKRFGQPMALVLLDIDDFKQVNDTYGHQQGDVVLREVGRVLRESCREIDEPARYGGEELAVVLPGTDLHGAYLLAERVRQGVESLKLPLMVARRRHPGHGQSRRGGAPRVRRRPGRARRSGRRGDVRRKARRKESRDAGSARPVALTARSKLRPLWACWTTPFASTSSSSAATVPTRRRWPARSSEALGPARRVAEAEPEAAEASPRRGHAGAGARGGGARAGARAVRVRRRAGAGRARRGTSTSHGGGPPAKSEPGSRRASRPSSTRAARRLSRRQSEDGDVLEGTPEFLEETPEHDRLWFEQRPPRDFDFDD